MRRLCGTAALVTALAMSWGAGAEPTASGSVGTGMFGASPQTSLDLGVDLAGDAGGDPYEIGLGARLRFVAGEGLRDRDWDDPSEIARIIRYAVYTRPAPEDGLMLSAAAGELGGATLGHGTVLHDYASGVDVDHGRLGAQVRVSRGALGVEALMDDVIAPRIGGMRGSFAVSGESRVGASLVGDLSAPTMNGATSLLALALEAEHGGATAGGRASGAAYADLNAILTAGAGLHLGARGELASSGERVRAGARAEARLGSSGYVPGWIGPLYEIERRELLDRSREGGMFGLSGLGELSLKVEGVGALSGSYSHRRGLADLVAARLSAPYYHGLQAAGWTAATVGGSGARELALAAELRARLPARLFVSLEAARLYTEHPESGMQVPIFTALAAVGGVLGEGR